MDKLPVFNLGILGVNVVKSPLALLDGELQRAQNAEPGSVRSRKGLRKRRGIALWSDDLGASVIALANITLIAERPRDPDTGDLQDNGDFGPGALLTMRAKIYPSAATTAVSNNTETTVSFDSEDYDVGALHESVTHPSRLTIPAGGDGFYLVTAQAKWATDADGVRSTRIYKNGALYAQQDEAAGSTDFTTCGVAALVNLVATDYVEMKVFHVAGGSLNLIGSSATATSLSAIRLLSTTIATLPRCKAILSANQTISNGAATAILFDTEDFDTHTMHDNTSNKSRITIPANQAGLYQVIGQYAWAATLVGPFRVIIRKNGTDEIACVRGSGLNDSTQDATGQVSVLEELSPTDYVEMVVTQVAVGGGTHDIIGSGLSTTLQVARVG